jgi:hypothetical protein
MKVRMRLLWWAMVRCERAAQWFRCRWLQLHEGRGAVVERTADCCVDRYELHADNAIGTRWECSCGRKWHKVADGAHPGW